MNIVLAQDIISIIKDSQVFHDQAITGSMAIYFWLLHVLDVLEMKSKNDVDIDNKLFNNLCNVLEAIKPNDLDILCTNQTGKHKFWDKLMPVNIGNFTRLQKSGCQSCTYIREDGTSFDATFVVTLKYTILNFSNYSVNVIGLDDLIWNYENNFRDDKNDQNKLDALNIIKSIVEYFYFNGLADCDYNESHKTVCISASSIGNNIDTRTKIRNMTNNTTKRILF